MQLARFLLKAKSSSYANRLLHHVPSPSKCESHLLNFPNPIPRITSFFSVRPFSTDNNNNNFENGDRNFTSSDHNLGNLSPSDLGATESFTSSWLDDHKNEEHDIFGHQWTMDHEETDDKVFNLSAETMGTVKDDKELSAEEMIMLQQEEKQLLATLQGPDRAFGDLITASGITDEMLDTLIALKDFEGVEGLPPLREIEDLRYEKNTRKSTRAEIELQKQENIAKSRVRRVDEKGRSYGTGRRKTSVARVWVQPGHGNFLINDKQFDVYFPMLDHRAALLRPFAETKTLGLWDVKCTVKGGGVSGQVGAIQLGISRALQKWEPDMHPALKSVGFLTRDPRAVERKKPGKAKARKSFQWVKR